MPLDRTQPESRESELIRMFLLGQLSAQERAAIQERMFRDEEFFARVRLAELDLVDACAAGWLPAGMMEPARRFLAESSQPDAVPASGGLAAALRNQESEPSANGWLRRLLGR